MLFLSCTLARVMHARKLYFSAPVKILKIYFEGIGEERSVSHLYFWIFEERRFLRMYSPCLLFTQDEGLGEAKTSAQRRKKSVYIR